MLRLIRKKATHLLLLFPVMIMALLIVAMLSAGVAIAFQSAFMTDSNFSFDYILKLLSKKQFLKSLSFTVTISLISTVLSTTFGILLADFLTANKDHPIIKVVTILPYISAIALLINTFGNGGFLPYLFGRLFASSPNMNMLNHKSGIGVVLLFIYKTTPYLIISFLPLFAEVNSRYRETAQNLGCQKTDYFFFILLPACKRSILSNFILIFNFTLFSFEPYQFLGPTAPKGIGVLANEWYHAPHTESKKLGMALNFIMMLWGLIAGLTYIRLLTRKGSHE